MKARLDTSSVSGSVSLASEPRPRADLDLQVDRLNTALYGSWGDVWATWRPRLEALDGSLALRRRPAESRPAARARSVHSRGLWRRAAWIWPSFGSPAQPAPRSTSAARSISRWCLGWCGRADRRRAGADSAAPRSRRADRSGPPGAIAALRLQPTRGRRHLRRSAARCQRHVAVAARPGSKANWPMVSLAATLIADAANTGDVLSALGWPQPAERLEFGPLAARLELSRADGPLDIRLDASAGGSRATGAATLATTAARPLLAGRLSLPRLDTELAAARLSDAGTAARLSPRRSVAVAGHLAPPPAGLGMARHPGCAARPGRR